MIIRFQELILSVTEIAEFAVGAAPILVNFHEQLHEYLLAEEFLQILAGLYGNTLQGLALISYKNTLLLFTLHVDYGVYHYT